MWRNVFAAVTFFCFMTQLPSTPVKSREWNCSHFLHFITVSSHVKSVNLSHYLKFTPRGYFKKRTQQAHMQPAEWTMMIIAACKHKIWSIMSSRNVSNRTWEARVTPSWVRERRDVDHIYVHMLNLMERSKTSGGVYRKLLILLHREVWMKEQDWEQKMGEGVWEKRAKHTTWTIVCSRDTQVT